ARPRHRRAFDDHVAARAAVVPAGLADGPAVKERRTGAHDELCARRSAGFLPESPRCEIQGRRLVIDHELELAIRERLDAGDVGAVNALLVRAVGRRLGQEYRPPPPQGTQYILQLLATCGQRVYDACTDRTRLPGHHPRPFQAPEPVSEDAGTDAG